MIVAFDINEPELERYARRVSDRWPLQRAVVGGARIDDARGVLPQRERGPEFVVILVSERFDGVPWLERVHQAANLWDASEMGGQAQVHCYTPVEFERKRTSLEVVRWAAERGVQVPV